MADNIAWTGTDVWTGTANVTDYAGTAITNASSSATSSFMAPPSA